MISLNLKSTKFSSKTIELFHVSLINFDSKNCLHDINANLYERRIQNRGYKLNVTRKANSRYLHRNISTTFVFRIPQKSSEIFL